MLCLGAYNMKFNQKMLRKVFGDAPATTSSRIKKLEKLGYLDREKAARDKRADDVKLSANGREKYNNLVSFLSENSKDNPIDADPIGL